MDYFGDVFLVMLLVL